MAGKDEIANAVLGGASDYMCDIFAKIIQWYYAKDDQKVYNSFSSYHIAGEFGGGKFGEFGDLSMIRQTKISTYN